MKFRLVVLTIMIISTPSLVSGQYIYFSMNGDCAVDGTGCWQYANTYYIFIKAPGITDAYGASFQFESDVFGPEDISALVPHDGVLIQSGDLHSGITLVWPPGEYSYDTLLTITTDYNEPHPVSDWLVGLTKEVQLYRVSGDPLELVDFDFICSHCYQTGLWVSWSHPDTVVAIIGEQSEIEFDATGYSIGHWWYGEFNVSDEYGWIPSDSICHVYCYCPPCPWDIHHFVINAAIPEGVPVGATSKVRIVPIGPCCRSDSSSFYIKAESKVPIEETSWGVFKSLFRGE